MAARTAIILGLVLLGFLLHDRASWACWTLAGTYWALTSRWRL